jgi:hypothetical protein
MKRKKPHTNKTAQSVVLPSSIPSLLLDRINGAGLSKIMTQHLLTLTCLVYNEFEEEELVFYKLLSQKYQYMVTSKDFVTKVFPNFRYNYRHVKSNKISEEESIFQTSGLASKKRKIANFYRINPQLLNDEYCQIQIEVPEEEISLNHIFPNIIDHFNYCTQKFTFHRDKFLSRLDQELMIFPLFIEDIRYSDVAIIVRNINELRAKKKNNFIPFFSEKVQILGSSVEMKVGFDQLKELRKKLQSEHPEKELWIIVDRHNYYIDDLFSYMERRQKRALKIVNNKVNNLMNGMYSPCISKSNGRFNHTLSNLNSFALKYLRIDGRYTYSKDLTASQFTILVNLMTSSAILKKSLYESKFPFREQLDVFFNTEIRDEELFELKQKLLDPAFDVYQLIARKSNVDREIAKKMMFTLLFNERPPKDKNLISAIPEFFANLKLIKEAFRNAFGNSKETLPVFLQMVESHIFIEKIYQSMVNESVVGFTRHDSITIGDNNEDKVKLNKILQDVFFEIDFHGSFKEDLSIAYNTTIQRNDSYFTQLLFGLDSHYLNQE